MAASRFIPLARSRLRRRSCLSQQRSLVSLLESSSAPSLASSPRPSAASRPFATSTTSDNNNFSIGTTPEEKNMASFNKTNGSSANANSNPSEVEKFSSFASHWWDSRSNPLVGMNPIRIKFMREAVARAESSNNNENFQLPLHQKRILDIGCGGGLLTESLSRLGASLVVGVDASTKVVEVAKMHSFHGNSRLASKQNTDQSKNSPENGNIRYIGGMTVEELADHWMSEREKEQARPQQYEDDSHNHELFDIITALEVIEHVPNPTSLLHAATKLLKPNGILFVSTINRTIKSYGLTIVAAEYITGKVPVGTHDWNQFWSPTEVERMVCVNSSASNNNATMKQIALNGMVIEPPFVNLQWSLDPSDVDVNWIGAYQKQATR